jgi:flagellar assembly protein FliH
MNAPTKFLFDVDFDTDADRKPTIALADHALKLAEMETAAHRRGYAEGRNDAKAAAERRVAEALERIAADLATASTSLKAIETRLECEAVEVAVAVARKLAPALIDREPFAEIAALASDCFRQLAASPHIAVRVNDTLYDATRESLENIMRARGADCRLVVLAEPAIAVGDCRIEWADGGINRDRAATEAAIGAAVADYINARRNFAGADELPRRSNNG